MLAPVVYWWYGGKNKIYCYKYVTLNNYSSRNLSLVFHGIIFRLSEVYVVSKFRFIKVLQSMHVWICIKSKSYTYSHVHEVCIGVRRLFVPGSAHYKLGSEIILKVIMQRQCFFMYKFYYWMLKQTFKYQNSLWNTTSRPHYIG